MTDDRYTAQDLQGTLRALSVRWRWLLERLAPDERAAVEPALQATAAAVGAASTSLDDLAAAATSLPPARQREAVERTEDLLTAAGRAAPIAAQTGGSVVGLFVSNGGVPKHAIDVAVIGRRGVEGDRQATRKHHGRVSQALCIWSADVIDALVAEGHPIAPGRAGENVLVRGIDWSAMRPAVRLTIGPVVAELSGYALLCRKNTAWFVDGDFRRIDPDLRPGWARVYATVVEGGVVRVGDPVTAG